MYHVLTNIKTTSGIKYVKGMTSKLEAITAKGLELLLVRGAIAPFEFPPLEVVFEPGVAEQVRESGFEVLDTLLGRGDLESVGLENVQEEVSVISEELGIGGS